jgi:uncharacterized membrane protein (DUF2068 family)
LSYLTVAYLFNANILVYFAACAAFFPHLRASVTASANRERRALYASSWKALTALQRRNSKPRGQIFHMKSTDTKLIRLIAVFKVFKAILLVVVGVGALKLIHADISTFIAKWVVRLGLDPGSHNVGHLILTAAALTPNKIKDLVVGSFFYAALFLTEGIGLWLMKRWAEWFTVISTSSLIPVEVYEICRHPNTGKVVVLVINLAVVAFLVYRIRIERYVDGIA